MKVLEWAFPTKLKKNKLLNVTVGDWWGSKMIWTSFHDYVVLGVDSLLVTVLYSIYRRRDQVIKNIAVSCFVIIHHSGLIPKRKG